MSYPARLKTLEVMPKAKRQCYIFFSLHFYQKGGEKMQEYIIRHVMEHVEVYNAAGDFLFSADTEQEAYDEIKLYCEL